MAQPMLCTHLAAVDHILVPERRECADCVKTGGSWMHLRTCQTCGGTHCCDSSPNKHATKHASRSGHPVVASAEPGEYWLWCYEDQNMAEYEP